MSGDNKEWRPSYKRKRDVDYSTLRTDRPKREKREKKDPVRYSEDEVSWHTQEKERLLEALYRHSLMAVESISHVVGTKTPKQVADFIDKMVNSSCLDYKTRRVELDPEKGAAPLELWLALVEELVTSNSNKGDYSKNYFKTLDLISRNEPMQDESGFVNMDWRNLYKFVCDMLADKAVLQPLSDMESLVILDMMHSLGDTLHTSDTVEPRRLLDLKYQLYKWQAQHNKDDFTASSSAIDNDFTNIEYNIRDQNPSASTTTETMTLTSVTSTPSSQPQPSKSRTVPPIEVVGSDIVILTSSSSSANHNTTNSSDPLATSTVSTSPVSTTPVHLKDVATTTTTTSTSMKSTFDTSFLPATSEVISTSTKSVGDIEYPTPNDNNNDNDKDDGNDNKTVAVSDTREDVFNMPQLFSLNPLTIPSHCLAFQPKHPKHPSIPVVIDIV